MAQAALRAGRSQLTIAMVGWFSSSLSYGLEQVRRKREKENEQLMQSVAGLAGSCVTSKQSEGISERWFQS
jgi:hypothetical protein